MSEKNRIFISAGEISGDFHAAELMKRMNEIGDYEFYGLGGQRMIDAGLRSFAEDVSYMNTIGFIEAIHYFRHKLGLFRKAFRFIQDNDIQTVIAVDNQGFSIPLLKKAKQKGLKTVYYIPPRVSIWGKWNAPKVAKIADHIIPFLSADVPFYQQYSEHVYFAGNPVVDRVAEYSLPEDFYEQNGLDINRPIVSLFPGSRVQEIKTLSDIMLKTARVLIDEHDFQVVIPPSHKKFREMIIRKIQQHGLESQILLIDDGAYAAMNVADVNIMASGTATLESALFRKPPIICYQISGLSYMIAKRLVTKKMIGLPNIILDRIIFPELIRNDFNVQTLVEQTLSWHQKVKRNSEELKGIFDEIYYNTGKPPIIKKTAQYIAEIIKI